jgi:hypothetical protein
MLFIIIIKLTKENRRRVLRAKDNRGGIGEGGCEETARR